MALIVNDAQLYTAGASILGVIVWFSRDYYQRLQRCESSHQQAQAANSELSSKVATLEGEVNILKMIAGQDLANNVAKKVIEAIQEHHHHEN